MAPTVIFSGHLKSSTSQTCPKRRKALPVVFLVTHSENMSGGEWGWGRPEQDSRALHSAFGQQHRPEEGTASLSHPHPVPRASSGDSPSLSLVLSALQPPSIEKEQVLPTREGSLQAA